MKKPGTLFVISGPSGVGKTELIKIVSKNDNIPISISYTTRPKRNEEEDGKHYHFVNEGEFTQIKNEGKFLECATIFGYRYGTTCDSINKKLFEGSDLFLVIDWQGLDNLRILYPENIVSIFILPPSLTALKARLYYRGEEDAQRLNNAVDMIRHIEKYDYVVVNDQVPDAVDELCCITQANRLLISNQDDSFDSLLNSLTGKN